jgi:hypothetical protein
MRDLAVVFGIFGWVAAVYLRLGPLKKRLVAEFGDDKGYYFFRKLAADGHPAATRLIREGRIFLGIAVIGGLVISLTK